MTVLVYPEDVPLLRDLALSPNPIDIYDFHARYRLSPLQVLSFVSRYSGLGMLESTGTSVALREAGVSWLFANRRAIFCQPERAYWHQSFARSIDNRLKPFETYIPPHKRSMDRRFFQRLLWDRGLVLGRD